MKLVNCDLDEAAGALVDAIVEVLHLRAQPERRELVPIEVEYASSPSEKARASYQEPRLTEEPGDEQAAKVR
jgi:hypothetical protein